MSTDDSSQSPKGAPRAGIDKASLAELIAHTPGAQTREQAIESIKRRRQKQHIEKPQPAISDDQIAKPEPLPIIDNPEDFAKGFYQRLQAKEKAKQKPPKRSKPRLLLNNEKSDPSGKK
jgi:hypothetical protein